MASNGTSSSPSASEGGVDYSRIVFNNAELFEAYNELQRVARDFETTFEAPEIIVVGTQSAGKSSLIEALVGFRFNYVGTGQTITRRPLVVQMMRNESFEQPKCLFLPEKDDFAEEGEGLEVTVAEVPAEIKRRTLRYCSKDKMEFYEVPIMLRVQYKYCANLTIIDMPGFVIQGNEQSAEKIRAMARTGMAPRNRVIVCLEESGRDWNLSIARPIVESVDPKLERTIIVGTKFDARLKELKAHPGSVNDYVRGSGYLPKLPFLFQLPIDRSLDGREFVQAIDGLAELDIKEMRALGIDEKYQKQIGFPNLRNYLENLLLMKYKESIPSTFSILNQKCKEIEEELKQVESLIEGMRVRTLRGRASDYVVELVQSVTHYLKGTIKGNPIQNGQTLQQEREASGYTEWPGLAIPLELLDEYVENAEERLYGGAQYYRLQREFEAVIRSIEFPPTTISEVATALGLDEMKPNPDYDWAACDIARNKIDRLYNPFLEIFCGRLRYIMKRLFIVVAENLDDKEFAKQYPMFYDEIKSMYESFIDEYVHKLQTDLQSTLEQISGFIIGTGGDESYPSLADDDEEYEHDLLQPSPDDTARRVRAEMNRKPSRTDPFKELKTRDVRVVDAAVAKAVMEESARHFVAIRSRFSNQFKRSANVQFWTPMYSKLMKSINKKVVQKNDEEYIALFNANAVGLYDRKQYLERKLLKLRSSRDRFGNVAAKIRMAHGGGEGGAAGRAAALAALSRSQKEEKGKEKEKVKEREDAETNGF